ncbi:phage portal protein [Yersinia ruckeri]|uniref:phage portal protein n=2 Tax=Yersinia ruckeri TaxID=29486 RepID=UPI000AE7AF22|nr:phage portal protein [Yersinia ruckeri]MCK8555125.1 phage portal protein [Yersinia ruckeri]MCW6525309.1 phage portal protein [Yersinia ruckeri]MCW6605813.1 phage portal protein [Yersinia ruckeri]MDN0092301.1 phage portal protein [Yersinia ruckeri]UZY09202.1 phage portal protein [Yersinia ruckeri]
MKNEVRILGPDGRPLAPSRSRASMLNGSGGVPYDAADSFSDSMANWQPALWSPDNEINIYRDRVVSRVRDMVRNDGWASGSVTRILDNAVGADFRPLAKVDYRTLALMTGNKAFDAKWADEYGRAVESGWRTWANDPGRYSDVERKKTVSQLLRLAFRHKLTDGDALCVMQYRPDRLGYGRAQYATAMQVVDPDRLCNPQQNFDMPTIRGGVEIDADGVPVAYHIRKAHMGDWWSGAATMTWERIPRETPWGRPIVIHDFDAERASQHRGISIFTPIVQRLKMLIKYDQVELESSILNSVFAAYITSPYDPQLVGDALDNDDVSKYQNLRREFHDEKRISLQSGARIPILAPGESMTTLNAARPTSNFTAFESAALRNVAAALGISTQQLTQDWSDVNYSSARSAMLEAWKTLTRRRDDFAAGMAQPILSCFIEELHDLGEVPLPAGAPDFLAAKAAYCRAQWMGPGRGWVDPVAEKKGAILGMEAGLSTLEMEAAENVGEDWEELLDQRQRERQAYIERDLPIPTWLQAETFAPDQQQKPEAP